MADKVDSASDARTVNNAMRHQYRVLSDEEKEWMIHVKDLGQAMLDSFDTIGRATTTSGSSRELALAKTNLEQAVMWAVKHITQ